MASTNFIKLRENLMNESISMSRLEMDKTPFQEFATRVITNQIDPRDPQLEAFLRICLDVYALSENGAVMIPDSLYDQCMQVYLSGDTEPIIYADPIGKSWNLINHEIPGVVGSIAKIYSYEELKVYLNQYHMIKTWTIAPKYDGVSCAIRVINGQIISAATRYNGQQGQDITQLILRASNVRAFMRGGPTKDCYYKCELCVSNEDFEELVKEKKYANRRSATSGIIGTPSNLNLAKYITIIPLLTYELDSKKITYMAPGAKEISLYSPSDFYDEIINMLEEVKSSDFMFRVDGVVINPDRTKLPDPDVNDFMENSIAYKVNTMEGKTKIRYGYMSVGRLGKAVPMVKVEPVEVNETVVEDVSLGSYDKFLNLELRENEDVIIYSAGDVIPQLKLPRVRANYWNDDPLKIEKVCPHCGEKLTRVNTEYYCMNEHCPRVITGKIANFFDKMGMEGFSDRTIELIYNTLHIKRIKDYLSLTEEDILRIDGFEKVSARNLLEAIKKIRETPVSISKFFGSLGIEKISERKCKKIFEVISLNELFTDHKPKKTLENMYWRLVATDGFGQKTAEIFIRYIWDNMEELQDLLHYFKLKQDVAYNGNVVFTGFRPTKDVEDYIHDLGYDVSESISSATKVVVAASRDFNSGKVKKAIDKQIPIYYANDLDQLLVDLKHDTIDTRSIYS